MVVDGAIDAATADNWLARVVALDRAGGLRPAGVGASKAVVPEIRSDRTRSVSDDAGFTSVIAAFAALGPTLRDALRIALPAFSLQVSAFPPGAHYARHVDAIRGDGSRRITAILYLDRTWTPDDGGVLRVEEPGGDRDVVPIGGRLVVFRSDTLAHEVLPPTRTRHALSAWYGTVGMLPTTT